MPRLILSKNIRCPDYGEIKILTYIPHNELSRFVQINLDMNKAFMNVLKSLVERNDEVLTKLSDNDLETIATEISRNYDVDRIYKELRGISQRPDALRAALLKSQKAKAEIEDHFLLSKSLADRLKESLNAYKMIIEPLRIHDDMLKNISATSFLIDEARKSLFSSERLSDIARELSVIKPFKEELVQSIIKIQESMKNSLSGIQLSRGNIGYIEETISLFSDRTNSLAKAFKLSDSFESDLLNYSKEFKDYLIDQGALKPMILSLAEKTLQSSDNLVNGANEYFVKWGKIPSISREIEFPSEIKQKKKMLFRDYRNSEILLETLTDSTIIASNAAVFQLINEVHILKKDVRELKEYGRVYGRIQLLQDPKSFIDNLKIFAQEIMRDHWRIFWVEKGEQYISNPERIAQSHLSIFLKGRYYGIAFVGREIASGNGYIDILVHYLGESHIVELKMVGCGWSIENAEDGLDQLDKYMHSEGKDESFLVVFDGRKTERGKKLKKYYDLEHGRVWVIDSKIYWV